MDGVQFEALGLVYSWRAREHKLKFRGQAEYGDQNTYETAILIVVGIVGERFSPGVLKQHAR